MTNSNLRGRAPSEKPATIIPAVLTPKEAAQRLRLSSSWLAKARMRGDGPPYIQIGRAIRYTEAALIQWMNSRQRLSPSEQ
jgi:predicted DNA-binding transcriptional regulator AlpA